MGGPSQVDTFDPKPKQRVFDPSPLTQKGIQVSELLPRVARQMDKLSIIRSMHHQEIDHPLARSYVMNGHRPSPAMEFASVGSIIAKERGPRSEVPPYVLASPSLTENFFRAGPLGDEYNPFVVPDPAQKDFQLPDLSLPQSITPARIENRRSFLKVVDRFYRHQEKMVEAAIRENFFGTKPWR